MLAARSREIDLAQQSVAQLEVEAVEASERMSHRESERDELQKALASLPTSEAAMALKELEGLLSAAERDVSVQEGALELKTELSKVVKEQAPHD